MKMFYWTVLVVVWCGAAGGIMAQNTRKTGEAPEARQSRSELRFDGLYCHKNENGRACLRFYEDGLVLDVSLGSMVKDSDLPQVVTWFTREPEQKGKFLSQGYYLVKEKRIDFSTLAVYEEPDGQREVNIDYEGTIENSGAELLLDFYSHATGNRQKARRYVFIDLKL